MNEVRAPGAVRIAPEDVVKFVPGRILVEANAGSGRRRRLHYRDYSYQPSTVSVPAIDSLVLVVYRHGHTLMRRRVDQGWKEKAVAPGAISILGPDRPSDWEWPESISVSHLYLSREFMADTAARAFDRRLETFETADELKAEDAKLLGLVDILTDELRERGPASGLLVDAAALALCLHTFRAYHRSDRPLGEPPPSGLTPAQRLRSIDFVEAHLSEAFSMADLAQAVGVNEVALLRGFKLTFGESPYQYVLARRVDRANDLIRTTRLSLAEIANAAGFADQSHMTRLVKRATGFTPGELRRV